MIPPELVERMKERQRQYRYKNSDLSDKVMKRMLCELSYESYYKNVAKIRYLMTGIKPMRLTEEQQNQILKDYRELLTTFKIYATGELERKNMCFFRYCFKKLCEKNSYTEFLRDTTKFMKSTDNLAKNDRLFKKCFKHLGWPWRDS